VCERERERERDNEVKFQRRSQINKKRLKILRNPLFFSGNIS